MNSSMQLCRLCASDKNVIFTIYNLDFDGQCFIDKLEAIVPGIVYCNITLPNGICTICAVQLNHAYTFIKQCFDTQIILKKRQLNEQLCRLCASNKDISLTLNSMDSDNILISYKLETIMKCNEELSDSICSVCSVRLNETYKFREKCFKTQEIFKQYAKQHLQNTNAIENEVKNKIVKVDTSNCSDKEEINTNFEAVYIKEEILDEEPVQLGVTNDTNILESETHTNFEHVYIKKETMNEEANNRLDLVVEKSPESKYLNLHSELIIKEDNSDRETKTDSKTHQVVGVNMNRNANNIIYLNEQTQTKKKHKCDYCEKYFTQRGYLKIHMRTHVTERPYKCTMCEKAFILRSNLTAHINTHTKEKPYKCQMCEKAFTQSGHLTTHIRIHRNEKPFKCNICGKAFTESGNLKSHIKTHSNIKPYKCEICEKAFTRSQHLLIHTRSHTQEKPYKCELCEKTFAQSGHLKTHSQTHTNFRPFKCQICETTFTRSESLTRHVRCHANKETLQMQTI